MGNKIKGCTVTFEQDLNEDEAQTLIYAIRMFRGVRMGEPIYGEVQANTLPPRPTKAAPPEAREFSEVPSPPGRPVNTPTGKPGDTIATQRHCIDEGLRWGLQNRKISLEDVQLLSPEALIETALGFIDMMPEEQRERLGQSASMIFDAENK